MRKNIKRSVFPAANREKKYLPGGSLLDIAGQVVTADAMSMQKDIIDKIREKKGDFVIELKTTSVLCGTK